MMQRRKWAKVPTRDEQRELILRAKAGDVAARDELIERNAALIDWMAARMPHGERDDLCQAGAMGLQHAIELFDPARGLTLATYATKWILQFMQLESYVDNPVWVPCHIRHRNAKKEAMLAADPDARTPAARRYLAMKADAARALAGARTISHVAGRGGRPMEFDETLPARESDMPGADEIEDLEAAMGVLSRREREVIRRRFWEGRTLLEIGLDMGVSKERVRQIEDKAIAKMREMMA